MTTARIAKAYGRGLVFGCVTRVFAMFLVLGLGVVFLGCLGVGFAIGLPPTVLLIGSALVVAGLLFVVFPGILIGAVMRRGAQLDQAFTAPGRQVGPVTRGWEEQTDGRTLNAWFSEGPQLEIYLSADTHTRMTIGRNSRLGGAVATVIGGGRLADLMGPLAALDLIAGGADFDWTRAVLFSPGVSDAIADVFRDDDGRTLTLVKVAPNYVKIDLRYLPISDITDRQVSRWIATLKVLAEAAEKAPAPATRMASVPLEETMRTARSSVYTYTLVGVGCGMALLLIPFLAFLPLLLLIDA